MIVWPLTPQRRVAVRIKVLGLSREAKGKMEILHKVVPDVVKWVTSNASAQRMEEKEEKEKEHPAQPHLQHFFPIATTMVFIGLMRQLV